jgi:hypothetical protein
MAATDPTPRDAPRRRFRIARGAVVGGIVGLSLSALYAALALVVWTLYLLATNLEGTRLGPAVIGAGILSVCGWALAFGVGVVPGTLIGVLIGLGTGLVLAAFRRTSPGAGALIGLIVGALVVAAINAGLARAMLTDTRAVALYWLWIGFPSIVTLAGSALIGWRLARSTQSASETL